MSQLLPGINALDHPTSDVITIPDEILDEQLEDTEFYEISICQMYVFFNDKMYNRHQRPYTTSGHGRDGRGTPERNE